MKSDGVARGSRLAGPAAPAAARAAAPAGAQSLGELARREAARKGQPVATGKRVYTNESLKPEWHDPAPPAPETAAAPEASPVLDGEPAATPAGDALAADQQPSLPDPGMDESFWRERAQAIRGRLNAKNAEIAALRQRIEELNASGRESERQITAAALAVAVGNLKDFTDEWLRFERQARDRGVPAEWIR
ncbi:MAG: hypothetical protein R2712_02785 [Vicinamibacterales bacterium]